MPAFKNAATNVNAAATGAHAATGALAGTVTYDKPFLTIAQQRELLVARGMGVADAAEAELYLRHEGYYRLSAYFFSFYKYDANGRRLDVFRAGSDFHDVALLYEFDKRLRLALLAALRSIEISVRVAVAHHLGERDIFAHENPAMLSHNFTHREGSWRGRTAYDVWLERYRQMLCRNDQEDFVRQFIAKYGRRIPIWVAIELWDFGLLSRFYGGMRYPDQRAVSLLYGVEDPGLFASWLRNFHFVRNVCAHHNRLWNRSIIEQPRLTQKRPIALLRHLTARGVKPPTTRVYATLALAAFTLRSMGHGELWRQTFVNLFNEFPQSAGITFQMTGAPANWRDLELWSPPAVPAAPATPAQGIHVDNVVPTGQRPMF